MAPRAKYVVFTANNYTPAGLEAISRLQVGAHVTRETRLTYLVFQQEVAESGTPHLQGYLQIEKTIGIDSVTKFLKQVLGTHARTAKANGTHEEARDYCLDEEKRANNTTPVEIGEIEAHAGRPGRGARTDLIAVKDAIENGMSLPDLRSNFFKEFAMYDRFLTQYYTDFKQRSTQTRLRDSTSSVQLRAWQTDCLNILQQPATGRKVTWFWENVGNVGKSYMARYLALHHQALIVRAMKKADMLHALSKDITTTNVVVFDLTRSTEAGSVEVVYEVIEQLLDQVISSGKYDSQTIWFDKVHVLVFANFEPKRDTMSSDRWDVHHIASV